MDKRQVIYDIERCICHVPDACRDCSQYRSGEIVSDCMERLLKRALYLLRESELVRCKDCKHATMTADGELCKYCEMCTDDDGYKITVYHDADWICADGERRIDDA